ncbi:MAG TPA: hypothetical protein VHC22_11115 [Pirellulales bacterium]|nr:hypothetical protein [Pirellulales bacterium]
MSLKQLCYAFVLLCLAGEFTARADDEPPPQKIRAEEARQYLGKKVTVTFAVQSAKDAVKRKVVFLDSEKDFRDPKNLGIIVPEDIAARLVQKIGANPATYYKDRTIRVVGKVVEEEGRCYIRLAEPEQIEVVEPESK